MQTEQELQDTFLDCADQIAKGFIDEYGLKHSEEIGNLSDPLLRWLDFVHRYIPQKPREVLHSTQFEENQYAVYMTALQHLISIMKNGGDLNPYQSKGLIFHNDVSGAKRQQRTDLLWADWGIHHLHITNTPIAHEGYFSDRSQWLLFASSDLTILALLMSKITMNQTCSLIPT